jgi:hypothetical protein
MRFRNFSLTLLVIGLLIALVLWVSSASPAATPNISFGVLGYHPTAKGPFLTVLVGLTNTSRLTIRCDNHVLNGDAWVRAESSDGRVFQSLDPTAIVSLLPRLLRPGSNTSATLLLPGDALRWQFGCKIRTASQRERVLSSLPPNCPGPIRTICQWLASPKEGPLQEVRSSYFECPPRATFVPTPLSLSPSASRRPSALGPNAF